MLRLAMFRPRAAWASNAATLLLGGGLITMLISVPLFVNLVLVESPIDGGLTLLRFTIAVPAGALAGGWLAGRIGLRATATVGMWLGALGFAGLLAWDRELSEAWRSLPQLAGGFGFGLVIAPLSAAVLAQVREGERATAASWLTLSRVAGMLDRRRAADLERPRPLLRASGRDRVRIAGVHGAGRRGAGRDLPRGLGRRRPRDGRRRRPHLADRPPPPRGGRGAEFVVGGALSGDDAEPLADPPALVRRFQGSQRLASNFARSTKINDHRVDFGIRKRGLCFRECTLVDGRGWRDVDYCQAHIGGNISLHEFTHAQATARIAKGPDCPSPGLNLIKEPLLVWKLERPALREVRNLLVVDRKIDGRSKASRFKAGCPPQVLVRNPVLTKGVTHSTKGFMLLLEPELTSGRLHDHVIPEHLHRGLRALYVNGSRGRELDYAALVTCEIRKPALSQCFTVAEEIELAS